MSECRVICRHLECRSDTGRPKVWHWLCEECATECADQHRRQFGHEVELEVTREPTIADLRQQTCMAAAMMRRRSWR